MAFKKHRQNWQAQEDNFQAHLNEEQSSTGGRVIGDVDASKDNRGYEEDRQDDPHNRSCVDLGSRFLCSMCISQNCQVVIERGREGGGKA